MPLLRPFLMIQHWKLTHCSQQRRYLLEKEQYDLRILKKQKKGNNINTVDLFLSTSARLNLRDNSFQSESPRKPVKKITNVSINTTQIVLSIRDNTQCREGILSDVFGENYKEISKLLPTPQATRENSIAALCCRAFCCGIVPLSWRTWGGPFSLRFFSSRFNETI